MPSLSIRILILLLFPILPRDVLIFWIASATFLRRLELIPSKDLTELTILLIPAPAFFAPSPALEICSIASAVCLNLLMSMPCVAFFIDCKDFLICSKPPFAFSAGASISIKMLSTVLSAILSHPLLHKP